MKRVRLEPMTAKFPIWLDCYGSVDDAVTVSAFGSVRGKSFIFYLKFSGIYLAILTM